MHATDGLGHLEPFIFKQFCTIQWQKNLPLNIYFVLFSLSELSKVAPSSKQLIGPFFLTFNYLSYSGLRHCFLLLLRQSTLKQKGVAWSVYMVSGDG